MRNHSVTTESLRSGLKMYIVASTVIDNLIIDKIDGDTKNHFAKKKMLLMK